MENRESVILSKNPVDSQYSVDVAGCGKAKNFCKLCVLAPPPPPPQTRKLSTALIRVVSKTAASPAHLGGTGPSVIVGVHGPNRN